MYSYESVQSLLKSNDLSMIKRAYSDLFERIDVSKSKSTNELLAAMFSEDHGLARNVGAEFFVPVASRQQKKCFAIR